MAQALNCNRCNAFVSFAPTENNKPGENPAAGWINLRKGDSLSGFDGSWQTIDRTHLCPDCVKALDQFMENKPIEPALRCGTLKLNVELFNEIMTDPKSFAYDLKRRKP